MYNTSFKNKMKDFWPGCLALAVLAVIALLGIYRCPLNYFVGIPCPLCGMTRALRSLLAGDVAKAFYYHPLWPVFIISAVTYILYYFEVIRFSKLTENVICYLLAVMLIVCFIIRHITHSPVVEVHFEDSIIGKAYALIHTGFPGT